MATNEAAAIALFVTKYAETSGVKISSVAFHALTDRIKTYLKDRNKYEVAGVCCLAVVYDGASFSPSTSLKWLSYDFLSSRAGVPETGWQWYCWTLALPEGRLKDTIQYWYDYYVDLIGAHEDQAATEIQARLQFLWDREMTGRGLW